MLFTLKVDIMSQVLNCEHPTIIVNPKLKLLVSQYRNITIKGVTHYFNKYSLMPYANPWCLIPPFKRKRVSKLVDGKIVVTHEKVPLITSDDLSNCYITDTSTGEIFPVYILVPCGKCDLCKQSRINSFVERCKMESQCYDSYPWFVTLTYDDAHLPLDGVRVRDVQLFLKRLRINLQRSNFNFRFRYVCSGEYGKNTHRPHYHLLLFGINTKSSVECLAVSDIIKSSWNNGFIQHRLANPADDKSFFYTAKYLKKDNFVPTYVADDGTVLPCNPCFMLSSRGNGGIGSHFIKNNLSKYMRRTLNVTTSYLNKWSGKVEKVFFSSYLLNIVFPTTSRSIPYELRSALRDFFCYYNDYCAQVGVQNDYTFKFDELKLRYHKLVFIPENFKPDKTYSWHDLAVLMNDAYSKIKKFFSLTLDSKLIHDLARKRDLFLSKLLMYQSQPDLAVKAYVVKKRFAQSAAREIL